MKIRHNVSQRFIWIGEFDFEGQPVDLSNLAFRSQVRTDCDDLIADLSVQNIENTQISIIHNSSNWPIDQVLKWDIEVKQGDENLITETVWIDTYQGATQ